MKKESKVCIAQSLVRCVSKRYVYTAIGMAMLFTFTAAKGMAADTATLSFTGTIMAGTCNLSVSPTSIDFKDIDPSTLIGGQWKAVNNTPFQLQLAGCVGLGSSDLTPVIQITGTLNTDSTTLASENKWLFKTGGTSKGFGVVVYTSDPAVEGSNEAADKEYISIPNYGKGSTLPSSTNVNLSAAVSTGRSAWSAASNLKAGSLKASVTFTFSYH